MALNMQAIADGAVSVVDLIGGAAAIGVKALPTIQLIATFVPIPYLSNIVNALTIAAPYIVKVSAATPIIDKAIQDGVPIADALQAKLPVLIDDFRQLFAIATNAAPHAPAVPVTAADVSDEQALAFATASYKFAGKALFGQRWTDEEYQRAWDRAQGVS